MKKTFELSGDDVINLETVVCNPFWLEAHISTYEKHGLNRQVDQAKKRVEELKKMFPNAPKLK